MIHFDLHCDTIGAMYHAQTEMSLRNAPLQVNLERLAMSETMLQCFAMFVPLTVEHPLEMCMEMIDLYHQQIEACKDFIVPITSYEEYLLAHQKHQMTALLTIEEGGVLKGSLAHLRNYYRLGVRMICLSWNYPNEIGYPNFTYIAGQKPDFKTPNTKDGLTPFGIEVIQEMNRLGMIIDLSHASDKCFYDALEYSTDPIIVSHSNARSVCNNVRNLTDDMIIKLAEKGGVMGMNFCPDFLNENPEEGIHTIRNVIRHMTYIKYLVGVDVIAIGSDYDGIGNGFELENAGHKQQLFSAMKEAGFTEEEIEKIAYKNFLRVMHRVLS